MFILTLSPLRAVFKKTMPTFSYELARAYRIQERDYSALINKEGYTKISFRPTGDVLIIDVTDNDIDSNEAQRFHHEVLHTRRDPRYQGYKKVLINFQNVCFMNSDGLGCLLGLNKRLQRFGGRLEICCLQGQLKEVMGITKVGPILNIKETEEEAFRALQTFDTGS